MTALVTTKFWLLYWLETCRLKGKNLSDFIHSVWIATKAQLIPITRDLPNTS
jgi:hypothetical protein